MAGQRIAVDKNRAFFRVARRTSISMIHRVPGGILSHRSVGEQVTADLSVDCSEESIEMQYTAGFFTPIHFKYAVLLFRNTQQDYPPSVLAKADKLPRI